MRPNDNGNDRELIAKAKEGNMEAFETLVRKYQRQIYLLCHRITGAHQTADDLSQETFIKAFIALPHFINGQSFYAWIRRIALNGCFNYLKKWKREKPLEKELDVSRHNILSPANASPLDIVQRDELEHKFKEAFKTLPANQRLIFALRAFEDMSYEEISLALRIPPGTVMSRLNRARKRLKAQMAEYLRRS